MRQLPDLITWVSGETSGSHPRLRSHSLVLVGFVSPCQPKCRACCMIAFQPLSESVEVALQSVCVLSHSEAWPIHGPVCIFPFPMISFGCTWKTWPSVITMALALCAHSYFQIHIVLASLEVWCSGFKSLLSSLFKESCFMGRLSWIGQEIVKGQIAIAAWKRKWQPIPVFLPGKSHGLMSLVGYRVPWSWIWLSDWAQPLLMPYMMRTIIYVKCVYLRTVLMITNGYSMLKPYEVSAVNTFCRQGNEEQKWTEKRHVQSHEPMVGIENYYFIHSTWMCTSLLFSQSEFWKYMYLSCLSKELEIKRRNVYVNWTLCWWIRRSSREEGDNHLDYLPVKLLRIILETYGDLTTLKVEAETPENQGH